MNNYKFLSLKTFGSTEGLYPNARKYRRVYDASECRYIYGELALNNLQLAREDWTLRVRFVCRNLDADTEVCRLDREFLVSKDTAIFYVREGWGTPEPGWWKKGRFVWEAYVFDVSVGSTYFYVTDRGLPNVSDNPYLEIEHFRLFECPRNSTPLEERRYLQTFVQEKTRYISVELQLQLKKPDPGHFPIEFQFWVYNQSAQLKAYMEYFYDVPDQRGSIVFDTGYGTDPAGYWWPGKYRIDCVFYDRVIGSVHFEVGTEEVPSGNLLTKNQNPSEAFHTPAGGNYKFQSLKVFGTTENFFRNQRKYRKVYDQSECRYLYAELALYNKLFDEGNWNLDVRYTCKNLLTNAQLCEMKKQIEVGTDQNVLYVREGWGTADPGWWKKGNYRWEVHVDDKFLSHTDFFIVDRGLFGEDGENPYFDIRQIRLFESPKEGLAMESRVYLKTFSQKKSRYINIEMELALKNPEEGSFPLELQFNFYNDAGQHKAYMEYFNNVTDQRAVLQFDTGYGAENPGYWFEDKYTLEVLFLDRLIAVVPFDVAEEEVEQTDATAWTTGRVIGGENVVVGTKSSKPTFEEATAALNALIGLGPVKKEISEFATYLQFLQLRKEQGFEERQRFNLNTIFTGNPGTGKTTVANMMGKIYHSLGLLSKGEVHEVGRVELVGEYIGQTAPKVKKAIDKARGGILFVDEAYALKRSGDDGKDFGNEVIEVLIKEMSDGPGDLAIIFAGYPKEMQHFVQSNPGLSSRISRTFHFPDYTPDELMLIASYSAQRAGVTLAVNAGDLLHKRIVEAYRSRTEHFGNARYVNGLIEEAKQHMALRVMSGKSNIKELPKEALSTIQLEDVEKVFGVEPGLRAHIPVDEALLQDSLAQLRELVGIANIKKEVDELVKLVRYYREIGKDVSKTFSMHTVLTGNPGTGKTTVARLLVRIYKALGILERGHLVECDSEKLIAAYLGQTAIKTAEMIEKSIGGGLFIDEAYSLATGGNAIYGQEAIETLLKRMEDQRGQFMVIVAGYPKEMGIFLDANPGLRSRFDKQFTFEDYSKEDLLLIAATMFDAENLHMSPDAHTFLGNYLGTLLVNKHKYFGNARTVRKVVAEVVRRQSLRLASLPAAERTPEMIRTVLLDDLQDFKLFEQADDNNRPIGFR